MAYSLTQELIRTGALRAWSRPEQGTLYDWSGNGNHGVASAGCTWQGGGIATQNLTDEITVPHAASISLTTYTVAWFGSMYAQTGYQAFFNKYAAGDGWQLWCDATDLHIEAAGTPKVATTALTGAKSIIVTHITGAAPIAYVNGLSIGAMDAASVVTESAVDLEIGNAANARPLNGITRHTLVITGALTATQASVLHGELA